jgi:glycosyltransferase involved in cell wall biosynthesis
MWAAVKRSDCILTVSEASKRDILHFFNVAPEKIVVVYNAIDEHFWLTPPQEDVSRVRERHRHKLHKHVRVLGYVSDDTLRVLYRLASVFVFPSLYEGFGLPPLEAMASGTPVVTSNQSSMPEVTGDAAVHVDPYDVGSIVGGIRRVLSDPALAAALRQRGPERAREFSWAQSVEKTRAVYEQVGQR